MFDLSILERSSIVKKKMHFHAKNLTKKLTYVIFYITKCSCRRDSNTHVTVDKAMCVTSYTTAAFAAEREEKYLQGLVDNNQIVFRYVDPEGNFAGYPWNPNGSIYNIAGICNPGGNVFGMMPHPERAFYPYTNPDWTRPDSLFKGDGRVVFKSVLTYIKNHKFK